MDKLIWYANLHWNVFWLYTKKVKRKCFIGIFRKWTYNVDSENEIIKKMSLACDESIKKKIELFIVSGLQTGLRRELFI